MDARNRTQGPAAAELDGSRDQYAGKKLDPTPPPDHAEFVELRSSGLQDIRRKLDKRRRKK